MSKLVLHMSLPTIIGLASVAFCILIYFLESSITERQQKKLLKQIEEERRQKRKKK